MKALLNKSEPFQQDGAERLERIAMVICLALMGVAGSYFAVLYLVGR